MGNIIWSKTTWRFVWRAVRAGTEKFFFLNYEGCGSRRRMRDSDVPLRRIQGDFSMSKPDLRSENGGAIRITIDQPTVPNNFLYASHVS